MNGQQLKNSILQMAVQGKLVPQDPNDEPASVLIQRIREEKEKLIKEKKIKKEKNPSYIFRGSDNLHYEKNGDAEPVCVEDQIPFEIPGSWEWGRISLISYLVGNKNNQIQTKSISVEGCIPVVSQGNKLIDGYSDAVEKKIQDLPLVMFGDHTRNVKYVDFPFVIGADGTKFHKILVCNPKYIYYWMYLSASKLKNRGYARHYSLLDQLFIPLPPLSEQERIVAKIETLLPHIDEYNTKASELLVLNDSFPERFKKSILQEAVQGKLVPQDPSDEPASILLEKIAKEKEKLIKEGKIKKEKSLPTITEDEIPFDIPNSWKWTRIGELFQHNTGKALNGSNKVGNVMTYITTSNLYWNNFKIDNLKSMPFREDELKKYTITKGDLLVCEGGDYGRTAIWNFDYDIRFQNHIHRLRAYLPLCTKYFYYVMYFLKTSDLINGKGITIQGLSSGTLHNLIIPLPPLEEQKRIVAKIEELMPLIDNFNKA